MIVPSGNLLDVRNLKTYFPVRGAWFEKRYVHAVDGVSFSAAAGKTLALVGESGSGKTTVGRTILKLLPATAGQVVFEGVDVLPMSERAFRPMRRRMQMIFQDPAGSLSPRMTVGSIVGEPLAVHGLGGSRHDRRRLVMQLLGRVGLSPAHIHRYPHEFSGGQRQRIGIARALASRPDFIVCDEPVSALDVSIQSQILNLLSDLQDEYKLTYLFIAHNLAVVEHFAHTVAVMYLGRIVEIAPRDTLYAAPLHPYTEALFSAVPNADPRRRSAHVPLEGETPSPITPPSGCPFHPRCPLTRKVAAESRDGRTPFGAIDVIEVGGASCRIVGACRCEVPALLAQPDGADHWHACHLRRAAGPA